MEKLGLDNENQDFDILQEIENQTSSNIRKQRSSDRLVIKSKVILQSGNSSELLKYKFSGISGDISNGGCCVMFPMPIKVGDVYRLQFDDKQLGLPLIFGRCTRCVLVREDAYKAGFSFFVPIQLADYLKKEEVVHELL